MNEDDNIESKINYLFKLIEKEFLNYEGDTPEKEFCKADKEKRKRFDKLGIAFTAAMNNNIDVEKILDAMSEIEHGKRIYYSFDELFEDAVQNGALGEFENQQTYLIERSKCNFEFNMWLQEVKEYEYGNKSQYQTFLEKDVFIEFLQYRNDQEKKRKAESAKEKVSWQIKPYQNEIENDAMKLIIERGSLEESFCFLHLIFLHKNAFWHDEKGLPIDCNIYHPKYGFPGVITATKDGMIMSFNNVIVYQDEKNREIHSLQILSSSFMFS
jgi:hypothetical protein